MLMTDTYPVKSICATLAAIALCLTLYGKSADAEEADARRYVIIHADDAGMSHSVNRGTIEAMEKGVVSSASIMVPCPWFPEFARYAKTHPEGDYGIHLTLNSEWDVYRWGPVSDPSKVPSLVDPDGFLWDNVRQVAENVKVEEAEIELRAQIERARKFGVPLSHLDTHMGAVLSRPDLGKLYIKLGLEYDLPILFLRPSPKNEVAKRYPDASLLVPMLQEKGLPLLDDLYQFYDHGPYEQRKQKYIQTLIDLSPGVSQIIIHCGFDDSELRHITSSYPIRDTDRAIFLDPDVRAVLQEQKIEVITWKDFREMSGNE